MNELQTCEFNILKAFVKVCEENNLRYYLVGGTCLGAIRHKGFIPWDDDIDVGMPREDYEKLLSLKDPFDDKKYFIQTYKSDKNYIYNYAKIRDSSTTFIESSFACHQFNHGVWIDLYPLDGLSNVVKPPKKFAYKVRWIWFEVFLMYLPALKRKISKKTWYKDIPLNIVALLTFWLNVGHYRNKLIDKAAKKYSFDNTTLVANLFGSNPSKEAMPGEIFKEGQEVSFEGLKVKVPKKYDQYLTLLYHDYMKLPPVDKQIGHHFDKGLSLSEDYITYRKKHRL